MTALASYFASADPSNSISVYTYGSPRVGNDKWTEIFDEQVKVSWRVVNRADPVPHLPDQVLGYEHLATEIWYENGMADGQGFKVCNGGEDKSCSYSVPPFKWSVSDHLDYIPKLERPC